MSKTKAKPNPKPCGKCGVPHARCSGHARTGKPCQGNPVRGATVCRMHGGSSPKVRKAAARRLAEAEAEKAVVKFGLVRDIAPADALLEEVQRSAARVAYYQARIVDEAPDHSVRPEIDRAWTKSPGVFVELEMRERKHLSEVAAAAIRAGAELQGTAAGVIVQVSWPPLDPHAMGEPLRVEGPQE